MSLEAEPPKVKRNPIVEKLAELLFSNPDIAKAVVEHPESLSARILLHAGALSLNDDLREKDLETKSDQAA